MYHLKVTAIEWDLSDEDDHVREKLAQGLNHEFCDKIYKIECDAADVNETLCDIITTASFWCVERIEYTLVTPDENDCEPEKIDSYLTCPRCQSKCTQVLVNKEPLVLWRHIADATCGDTEVFCGAEEYECTSKECGVTFWTGES